MQYFLADQKYTTVRHVNGEDLIEDSLRLLESEFGQAFVRIHRNTLVAVRYLERIERNAEGQYFVRLRGCADAAGGEPPYGRRAQGALPDLIGGGGPAGKRGGGGGGGGGGGRYPGGA